MQPDDTLRYEGIYQSQAIATTDASGSPSQVWGYLRFYPDSLVVSTLTHGRPHELSNLWLGNELLPYGSVSVRGNRIAFTVHDFFPGGRVTVEYDGYVQGDRLYLQSLSDYDGIRRNEVYTFIPMDTERLDGVRARAPARQR